MSAELKDGRYRITALAWCYLEAEHRAGGGDQSEIVRKVMHEWALRKHRAAIEAQKLLASEGIAGNGGEDEGTTGKGG